MIDPTECKEIPGKDELVGEVVPNLAIQTSRGSAAVKCTS